jgi:hypothetical protein
MPSTLSSKFPYRNAKTVVDSIRDSNSSYYVFYGRTQAWDDEENPPTPIDSLDSEYSAWHDMTALKKVDFQDARLGFKRIDWTSGTVYDEYSDIVDLSTKNFYVYTDEQKVYKCISNNKGAPSTVKPTHTTNDVTAETDGYKWKYMFTLSDSLLRKFFVPGYLPISFDQTVVDNAEVGSIENINIVSAGDGYPIDRTIGVDGLPVFVGGDGEQNASAQVSITVNNGEVTGITVDDGGSNYPYAPETDIPVAIRQVGPNGAVQTAYGLADTDPNGQIVNVTPVIGGSSYTTGSAFVVRSTAEGVVETNSSGAITRAEIATSRAGQNFRKATAVVVASTTGTTAELRPVISPFEGHGAVPEQELLARYALINLRFAYDEGQGDFTVENDFRRIGLIQDPFEYGSFSDTASAQTMDAKYRLTLDQNNAGFTEDDTIVGQSSGAIGLQVDVYENNVLRVIRDDEISNSLDFQVGEVVKGLSSGVTATITAIDPPEVEPYSGDVLFINNRESIDRRDDQIESITLVMEY